MFYLQDKKFLKTICSTKHQKIYIKIDLLNLQEMPIESIEGVANSGSINLDGTSALQRTCSLSLIVNKEKYAKIFWALSSLIRIFVGVSNNTDKYTDFPIIYFPMGIYYLTSFNLTENNSGLNISISGKDKMSKLTGELGGTFNSSVNFGEINIIDSFSGENYKELIPINKILTELLHFYGQEPYEKIILKDIDDYGQNLLTYRGDSSLYYFINLNHYKNNEFIPQIINYRIFSESNNLNNFKEYSEYFTSYDLIKKITNGSYLEEEALEKIKKIHFFTMNMPNLTNPQLKLIHLGTAQDFDLNEIDKKSLDYDALNTMFTTLKQTTSLDKALESILADLPSKRPIIMIGRYNYGDNIGYELTPVTYPGTLIANAGETIVSVLDKIKTFLGNFIYFYDIDGNFVFKKRNEYLIEDQPLNINFSKRKPTEFLTDEFISSLSYSYNLSNIKNDFTVWGERKTAKGTKIDLHARYAIDEKPLEYTTLNITEERATFLVKKYPNLFYTNSSINKAFIIASLIQQSQHYISLENISTDGTKVDWRELIYQMAKDFSRFNQIEEFQDWLIEANPSYVYGKTGYERYYTDILGFWRDIYNDPFKTVKSLESLKTNNNILYSIRTTIYNKSYDDCWNINNDTTGKNYTNACRFLTSEGVEYIRNKTQQEQIKKELGLDKTVTVLDLQRKETDRNFWASITTTESYGQRKKEYENIKYDIKSDSFPNIKMYYKSFDDTMVDVGYLNDIIATNYEILGYMYYVMSPEIFWNYLSKNTYLISEDIRTHKVESGISGSQLWRIMAWNADRGPGTERFDFYNNKMWTLVSNNQRKFLGTYYDVTTLYYKANDRFQTLSIDIDAIDFENISDQDGFLSEIIAENNSNNGSDNNSEETNLINDTNSLQQFILNNFLPMKDYPLNKDGYSLTNIKKMENDKMALLLWAREHHILIEKDTSFDEETHWKKYIFEQPDLLNFWFDFLSVDKFNQEYSIRKIGPREIVKKDSSINCITYLSVPDVLFMNPLSQIGASIQAQWDFTQSTYYKTRPTSSFLNLNQEERKQMTIATTTKSALDVLMNLIYNHAIATNSLTISCIPQYYLQPDLILEILNSKDLSNKQYVINKISFSLDPKSMMTINATEFTDNILNDTIVRNTIVNVSK